MNLCVFQNSPRFVTMDENVPRYTRTTVNSSHATMFDYPWQEPPSKVGSSCQLGMTTTPLTSLI